MPMPGYVFRDGGTTPPPEENTDSEFRKRITQATIPITATSKTPPGQNTSTGHQLATGEHDILGAAQKAGMEDRITHQGWQANAVDVDTLVDGLPNEELWIWIRRFNKASSRLQSGVGWDTRLPHCQQIYHVKAIPETPLGGLDLYMVEDDDFSPDRLRSNVERLYMTVIVGLIGLGKHIARLRSWREPRRTAAFAAVYFLAWIFNVITPASLTTIIVLVTVPQSRDILFPPAPPAGVLGSHDNVAGAPEKYPGEAVEQDASNWVSRIASVASRILDSSMPDPPKIATTAADASSSVAQGVILEEDHDQAKQPMEDAIWRQMRPAMHVIGDISDMWERLANALSPTPPFSSTKRLQLGAALVPLFLWSLVTKPPWVMKGSTFFAGFVFFSDPLMRRGIEWLNRNIPDWPKYLEMRNTLLKGVPTNAQLTITLLRIGEANRTPLPPPDELADIDKETITVNRLDASHSEVEDVITVDKPSGTDGTEGDEPQKMKKGGFGAKVLSAFKHTTAGAVEPELATDSTRATMGSHPAQKKWGGLPPKAEQKANAVEGLVEFQGRRNGRKAAMYVDSSVSPASGNKPASPCVYFTTHLDGNEIVESVPRHPDWAVSIADLTEVKKIGGLGWKGKILAGRATNREVEESIELITGDGKRYRTMTLEGRDTLFNRIISMGQQVWGGY
ncbi:uncharacterized protein Z518_06833 [Rhinocladiella mackenziei CBS 650.93]|uniref:Uncharacterized protein n=1 Tax=Rhinocladiella mackenziei CBS 650.93 TaxID=1442369 RepID=A0A0D2IJ31_9EURO|nr:uncharacterized protein Z518_06833 [Rhinocladiella mackenziei CBS 650.93]KIX03281.1 hypothetical protein Z518_06833 [Rhinocladiella mackenziei CBS 650.93]